MKRNMFFYAMRAASLCAVSFAVFLISSCSDDETVTPAMNNSAPASDAAREQAPTADGVTLTFGDPSRAESVFYPGMPANALIYIAQGPCEGACPAYTVSIEPSGRVTYTGYVNVGTKGVHTYMAGKGVAQSLAESMLIAGFADFRDYYPYRPEVSMHVTGLNLGNGNLKIIQDYGYLVPSTLVELRSKIETSLGIDGLIRLDPGLSESAPPTSGF